MTTGFTAFQVKAMQLSKLNSSNYSVGQVADPNTISNGTTSHAYLVKHAISTTSPEMAREIARARGGGTIRAQVTGGITDLGSFVVTMSDVDPALLVLINSTALDTTQATSHTMFASNPNLTALQRFSVMLSVQFTTTDGNNTIKCMNLFYPNCTINYNPQAVSGNADTNPNPQDITIVPSLGNRTVYGQLFSATTLALTDNTTHYYSIEADYPLGYTFYKDDASATSFIVGYRPVNSEHAGAVNYFFKNGSTNHANVSGFSTTTGATTHTAGSAGDMWGTLYATNFQAI